MFSQPLRYGDAEEGIGSREKLIYLLAGCESPQEMLLTFKVCPCAHADIVTRKDKTGTFSNISGNGSRY